MTRFFHTLLERKAWTAEPLTVTFVIRAPIPPQGEKELRLEPGRRATIQRIVMVMK